MPDKPSRHEDDYFKKKEAELLEKRKREAETRRAQEEREARKQQCFMRCPKCGAQLAEERYHGVAVDCCPSCKGLWFDAGEAESLLDREPGALQSFFGDLVKGLGGGKKSS